MALNMLKRDAEIIIKWSRFTLLQSLTRAIAN